DRIEKYICLTLSARETRFGSQPYKHETELFRVAGRKGEDAATAVRCLHRRNHARLIEHQARERTELLHTLAELREITAREREGHPSKSGETFQRNLSVIFLKLYGQALNLFSLTEDEKATGGASRLLEAECARLRRMEREVSGSESSEVDESCKTHAQHLALSGLTQNKTGTKASDGCA